MSYSAQYGENFEDVNKSDDERERLNGFNARLRDWYSGKLTLAPIDVPKIKLVLEIGAGSGAWALDAAEALPEAHIIVTDIAPLPGGVTLSTNAHFQTLGATGDLPFAQQSFDVIHARQVLMHVKDAPCMLARIVTLLKPGG